MTSASPLAAVLSGCELRDGFAAASEHLSQSASAVDAINVYPVPDGDTGSNMAGTLREAVERTLELDASASVAEVLSALATGALYGARGNSGVILSQALRGFAEGVGQPERLDATALAAGLGRAAEKAYAAVTVPEEGTMLTVLRAAANGARETAQDAATCATVLAAAVSAAEAAEAQTQEQLPALTEAGVPDAGGEGVCVILRGLLAAVTGAPVTVTPAGIRPIARMSGHESDGFGFCTEFLIEPTGGHLLALDALRALASEGENSSVVVVGDETLARVHAHSREPRRLLDGAEEMGRVSRVKVEDMDTQNVRFGATGSGAAARVAVLALSHGAGFDTAFRSLGAETADLGEVVKPAAGAIAKAADALGARDVIVLPNHKNVLLAATQAVTLARCTLHVVPSATLPQGIAAAAAFDVKKGSAENVAAMGAALAGIKTVEVTTARANRTVDGVRVREGDVIALVDGTLVAAAAAAEEALLAGLRAAGAAAAGLITVYVGDGGPDLETLHERLAAAFPGVEVEAVAAGQPLYPCIASVE